MSDVTLVANYGDNDSAEIECSIRSAIKLGYIIAASGDAQVSIWQRMGEGDGVYLDYLGCMYRSLSNPQVVIMEPNLGTPVALDNAECDPFGWVANNCV